MARDPHRDQPVLAGGAPLAAAAGALVLVHGRGASAQDMLALARELERPRFAWFAPEAAGRSWYPVSFLEPLERNRSHLNSAFRLLRRILEKARTGGVPAERAVLLGFSQGGCLVLEFAARHARRYGGLIGLSAGLMGPDGTPRDYPGSFDGTPVFLGSGDLDPHIPKRRVEETARVFERMGAQVTARIYPGLGHSIHPDEMAAIRELLDRVA